MSITSSEVILPAPTIQLLGWTGTRSQSYIPIKFRNSSPHIGQTHQQKLFNATCHVLGKPLEADGILLGGLIPQLHLMFGGPIARPLRSTHSVSDGMRSEGTGTNADADLDRGLVSKLWRECTMQLYVAQSGAHDRYAQAPMRVNEEHGHTELGLLHIAAAIACALREPKLLRHNRTTILNNSIIKRPRASSIYRMRGRSIERRLIERVEGAALVTDCLDIGNASYVEELD